jgi:NTE family protein
VSAAANRIAFVLGGGGGPFGAHEVGMLRALIERGIVPDLVLGTSIGAINGVAVAADPSPAGIERLTDAWADIERSKVFDSSVVRQLARLARTRTHLHSNASLCAMLDTLLPVDRIEDLAVPFQCVAASIERACEHWFADGPIVPAVVASAAVPGLLAPVKIGGEHFIDGGVVNSIPLSRAIALGAQRVYVLHVGRLDRPLEPPRSPWEVALVAFEIARRHRFVGDLAMIPSDVEVHVLPTGQQDPPRFTDRSQFRYRDTTHVVERIDRAHEASARYLDEDEHGPGRGRGR